MLAVECFVQTARSMEGQLHMQEKPDVIVVESWNDVAPVSDAPDGFRAVYVDVCPHEELPPWVRGQVAAGNACIVRAANGASMDELMCSASKLTEGFRAASGGEADSYAPGVSVLIPMYRAGSYAAEAIESVVAQTATPAELVVVDDGSEDDSAAFAWEALRKAPSSLKTLLVYMPHRGQAASRNTGLALARAEWVFYLDADDVLMSDALEVFLAAASDNPHAGMVCSRCQDFISPDLSDEEAARLKINPEPYQRMLAGCTLIKHSVYDIVGSYDESLPSSETAQWMLRMNDCGIPKVDIDAVTLMRRYHRTNFGRRDRKTQLASYMAIIKQRRAQRGSEG